MKWSRSIAGVALLLLSGVGFAQESPVEGWEANLTDAVERAEAEQKLIMQFRLIGRFERPDC